MTAEPGRLAELLAPRRLGWNVAVGVVGWILPALSALAAFPLVAARLGPDRFAIIALAWGLAGWFAQCDFGIGRGLTRTVAARHAARRDDDIPSVVWSAHVLLAAFAFVIAAALWAAAPALATRVLHVPHGLQDEALRSARWMAVGVVPIVLGTASRAVLEARQQFRLATAVRIPTMVATYLLPLLADNASDGVAWIVGARTANAVLLLLAMRIKWVRPAAIEAVAREGGWITLSAVISPLLAQGDRFAIAALLPIAASGSYAAAQEVATKIAFFSVALQPVLFAAVSAAHSLDEARARALVRQAALLTAAVVAVPTLVLAVWAQPLMGWWLKSAYNAEAAGVLPWMSVAMFANAMAQVPFAFLQAGRGDRVVALLHMAELPVFAVALLMVVPKFGITGAAAVWGARLIVDSAGMWTLAARRK
jgi:O-antigen/teichoic acid export membrane protein